MGTGMLSEIEALRYSGYRLNDIIFWAIPLLGLLSCAIHAARRAFRQPTPPEEGTSPSNLREG